MGLRYVRKLLYIYTRPTNSIPKTKRRAAMFPPGISETAAYILNPDNGRQTKARPTYNKNIRMPELPTLSDGRQIGDIFVTAYDPHRFV